MPPPAAASTPASAAIEVSGLRKSYGDVQAVRSVDFAVERGEVFALLGPNGAGKTTTLEILEGYRVRDAGQVSVLGMDPIDGGRELRDRIGIVLQETAVDPFLTAREVLTRNAGFYSDPRPVAETLDLVGMTPNANVRVQNLSGGQQRRLDVALGIIGNPELLFLDEPTTGFDPSARRGAWDLVRQLTSTGTTILLTTHYMEEAQELADRVAIIANGRIVACGPPTSLTPSTEASTHIRFRIPANVTTEELPVPVTREGDWVVIGTDDVVGVLHRLTTWAMERGYALGELTVTRPTLEDVYLRLTQSPDTEAAT
jgi:ABC-2 type transport system ATP-binding protein